MGFLTKAVIFNFLLLSVRITTAYNYEQTDFEGGTQWHITYSEQAGYTAVQSSEPPANTVAAALFKNDIAVNGWSYLHVWTNDTYNDTAQAYAAGYAEAYTTSELVYLHYLNTLKGNCVNATQFCKKVNRYLEKNLKWIKTMVKLNHGRDPYWHQVGLFFEQLRGFSEAWQSINGTEIGFFDFLWMNIAGDLEDLSSAFAEHPSTKTLRYTGRILGSGSCSALIKILPDFSDLHVAHDTWTSYQSMLRILKRYDFNYHMTSEAKSPPIPSRTITMSSYPALLFSMDDYYLTSSGLAVLETTIGNSNNTLWKYIKPKGSILSAMRTMTATRLSSTGKQWTDIFSRYNSGTYNNQWMVVDYKLFKQGFRNLSEGLLWVLEQLPGMIHAEDKSDTLRAQMYWPSYNTPYFEDIFISSGSPALVEKFGDWFSYNNTPRAQIFRRDQQKITNVSSTVHLMRSNNYEHDPFSACNCTPPYSAENAISARNDLNPPNGTYPFPALGHRSHGGIDMKMTNVELVQKLHFISISGPTAESLPAFSWSTADFSKDTPHFGQPDLWKFKPIIHIFKKFCNSISL